MYNAELKNRFLDTVSSKGHYQTCFNNFETLEEQLGKDLCQMTKAEIVGNFLELNDVELPTAADYIDYLNKYRRWCADNKDSGAIAPEVIDPMKDIDYVSKIQRTLYVSFAEINSELKDNGYDFDNGDEAAPALALAWLGLDGTSILDLKVNQVDLATGTIFDESGTTWISIEDKELLEVLRRYKGINEAKRNYNGEKSIPIYTGYFIHKMGRPNENKSGPANRQQVNRRIRAANKSGKLSSKNVRSSGTLFRMRQAEERFKFGFESKSARRFVADLFECKDDQVSYYIFYYQQYKKAFNLD